MEPIPAGTVVEYDDMPGRHYIITSHCDPEILFTSRERQDMLAITGKTPGELFAVAYPDGVAYAIFPVGMEMRFGNLMYGFTRVRRGSLTPAAQVG